MKKKFVLSGFSLILSIAVVCRAYISYDSHKRENGVFTYLESKGYSDLDINQIQVEHSFLKILSRDNPWEISVVFEDEPSAIYSYVYKSKTEILQVGGFKWNTETYKDELKNIELH